MSNTIPRITVLMPVYNGEKYLREAVGSILLQTFRDFEFLIINDGSTDRSVEIIKSYTDRRILLIHNENNLGLSATLNNGINLAQGEYIARMDCDDISLPYRLERQIEFMDKNPHIGIAGAWVRRIGENEGHIGKTPLTHNEIKAVSFFESPFAHPTVIIRKDFLARSSLKYDTNFTPAEDYDLWEKSVWHSQLSNIPDVLVLYRSYSTSLSRTLVAEKKMSRHLIGRRVLERAGFAFSPEEYALHCRIGDADNCADMEFLVAARKWLEKLEAENCIKKVYNQKYFERCLGDRWLLLCRKATTLGPRVIKIFGSSKLAWHLSPTLANVARVPHFLLQGMRGKSL